MNTTVQNVESNFVRVPGGQSKQLLESAGKRGLGYEEAEQESERE